MIMAKESIPQIGSEEQRIVEEFVEASAWTVGQRLDHGNKGYHLRTADPHGIQSRADGEIWTAPVDKSFPEGVGFNHVNGGLDTVIDLNPPHGSGLYPNSIAPPVDRFMGLPGGLAVMGAARNGSGRVYVEASGWSYRTHSDTDSHYRMQRKLLSPNPNGELEVVDFGMVPAVVVAGGALRKYRELEGRPYERSYPAHKVAGPVETVTETVEERIPRRLRKDRIVSRKVEKKVPTYIDVPAGVSRGVNREAILDPGNTPLILDGVPYVMSRIFYPEDHKIAVTPWAIARDMAEVMSDESRIGAGVVIGVLNQMLKRRHPGITRDSPYGSAGESSFVASWKQ